MRTFDVTLEFLSDWHVGTGEGRLGTVDAQVRRDHDGLPFVPAKTLVGVWRDACETVAATFDRVPATTGADNDSGRAGTWSSWVDWLFGSQTARVEDPAVLSGAPVPAALRLVPARISEDLRTAIRGKPALAQAAVVLRPGVRIDDRTGTAEDRLLRVEERALRGLRLSTTVEIVWPDTGAGLAAARWAAAELLLRAGAHLVEALGGKRNRGSGRVAILLPGSTIDLAVGYPMVRDPRLSTLLAGGVPPPPPRPPREPPRPPAHGYGRLHPGGHRTIRLALRVVTPVVTAEKVVSNIITSGEAIPGTTLLGTVLSRIDSGAGNGPVGLGDVSVGDAVPAIETGTGDGPVPVTPALPVPRVWHRSGKGRGETVFNTLGGRPDEHHRAKPMSGWVAPAGDRWQEVDGALVVSTHAVIDDRARRPTNTGGGVFTYLGIAPGTLLCSDIVLPEGAGLRLTKGDRLRFGRSRKDDFGLVEVVGVFDVPPEPVPSGPVSSGVLRVWCVSDVLLRDARLAPDPSPRALAEALSASLAPARLAPAEDAAGTAVSVVRREGFGVAWGRPRGSQVALRAGSVVTLTVTGQLTAERIAAVEHDGIGDRIAEGFGRIRINPPELDDPSPKISRPDPSGAPSEPGGGVSRADPVHPVEALAWRREIRRASAELAPDALVTGIERLASRRAQLGALRAQLERLLLPGGEALVRSWLDSTRSVRRRQEAWSVTVLDDLHQLLIGDQGLIWKRLGLDDDRPGGRTDGLVLGAGRAPALRAALHTEALVTALTDMLRKLTHAGKEARR